MRRRSIRKRFLLVGSAVFGVLMWTADRTVCQASSLSWSSISGGDWGNSANWNPQQTPTSADDTTFALGATSPYAVTLSANEAANSITVSGDQVSINPEGNTLSVGTVSVGYILGGAPPASTLNFAGSGTINMSDLFGVGNGTVSQSGDYVNAADGLSLNSALSTAKYLLSSGTLVASGGGEGIGNVGGISQLAQSGGTNQFNVMYIGSSMGIGCSYSLQGGSASGGSVTLQGNDAALTIAGGSLQLSGSISATSNILAGLTLSAGTLEVGSINFSVPYNNESASFGWTGGALILHGGLAVGPMYHLNGSLQQSFSVPSGGTLISVGGGIGNALIVSSGATLSIGNGSPSTLRLSSINAGSMSASSTTIVQVNGTTPGTGYSQLQGEDGEADLGAYQGNFSLGGKLVFNLGYPAAVGDQFTIVDDVGPVEFGYTKFFNGTFAGLAQGAIFNEIYGGQTYGFQISYSGGGNDDDAVVTTVYTPEPCTLGLLFVSACVVGMRCRRFGRSRKNSDLTA